MYVYLILAINEIKSFAVSKSESEYEKSVAAYSYLSLDSYLNKTLFHPDAYIQILHWYRNHQRFLLADSDVIRI